ncbi:ABC transporter permease [Falsibacillus albus]|uniref:ABC transporter permease n=1 Tax=Falsibacillus albus TaxID=2478915 RepID=UPI001F312545
MGLMQSIKMALRSIRSNKLRAFLTMLGIIIGVSSVIILISIGQGSTKSVTSQINQLGTNLLTVNVFGTDEVKLDNGKVEEIKKLNGIKNISPSVSGRVTLKYGRNSSQVSLTGTNAAYQEVRDTKVSRGRFLSDLDLEYRQKVVVLGSTTAETLFGFSNPIGQAVQVNGTSYQVVGVLQSKGQSLGQSGDDTVIMPLSTAQRVLKTTTIQTLYIQGSDEHQMNFLMNLIERKLASMFPNQSDNYSVVNQQDLMDTMSSVTNTMTMMLGGIAGISLLVGGIGIMNIMLVSVSERTKEIGICKAIGAKRSAILLQFLVEAVVISSLGGLIGVLIGIGGSQIASTSFNMSVSFSPNVMVNAFLFSLFVGVVFGVFPANKASKLHPIQALRYE